MTIVFHCDRCGHRLEVDPSRAGRKGRCKRCGQALTVPSSGSLPLPAAPPEEELGGYALEAGTRPEETTFVRARAGPERAPPIPVPAEPTRKRARGDGGAGGRIWTRMLWGSIALAVLLGAVALLVPGGAMIAGLVLSLVGTGVFLYGYGSGAYIAFTEDSLYGCLYLLIPFFTAYYVVSRWDDMWPRFALMTAGAVLMSVAAWVMGAGLDRAGPGPAPEGEAGRLGARTPVTVRVERVAMPWRA